MKKIFTTQQLSLFFKIGLLLNIASLFCDLIIYHYFPNNATLDFFSENLNNLSIFMVCLVIISQALMIFIDSHEKFVTKYKIAAITIEACMCIFILWLLMIENDIQGKAIIFLSSLSIFDRSYKLMLTLSGIFLYLIYDFYTTLKQPVHLTNESVFQVIQSTFRLVLRKHIIIFIFIFAIIQFKTLNKFAHALLDHSESSLFFDLTLLECIIPIIWIGGVVYYIYHALRYKNK